MTSCISWIDEPKRKTRVRDNQLMANGEISLFPYVPSYLEYRRLGIQDSSTTAEAEARHGGGIPLSVWIRERRHRR